MSSSVTVSTPGLREFLEKIDTLEELPPLRNLLVDASAIAKDTAAANVRRDTGHLASSFAVEIEPFSAMMYTPLLYARPAEKGRAPGLKAPPMPDRAPINPLAQWATRHGIENLFMLARSIGKRGVKGRFFRRKARNAVKKEMPHLTERMARELESIWAKGGGIP